MPHAAPSRCTEPGCTELALVRGRCGEHRRVGWREDDTRSSTVRLGISGSGWQALRLRILKRDEWTCYVCRLPGADEVDHIIPTWEGGAKLDPANLAAIHAEPCHREKTDRENIRRRATRPSRAKLRP